MSRRYDSSPRCTESVRVVRRPRSAWQSRPGVTLLELILALALTVMLLGAIAMAIQLNLRSLNSRRSSVEEVQLARAVLRMISEDIRATVQYEEQDFSAVEKMMDNAVAAQAADAASALGSAAGQATGRSANLIVSKSRW